ncbi:YiiX/YebB-like N1pC/P60 family cysteine hydrolase [Bacillus cereus]|uniref:Uncharacterized protein n=1 Tax=Bacillus cereus (strain VD146) TaxID=1053236 RepID=R8NEA1_BACCX|nr:YiiX/YebB-like N1pC/P60 family cysteine hydrolase [Bacillus cereus]EOP44840.1 hypothetical protein IK1_04573 [Bacillus cereus VD146]
MLKKGISSFLLFILLLCSFSSISSADVVKETVNKPFYAYNEPVFTSQKSNGGQQYGPQTLDVKEKRSNGWWKVQTWEGDKWINLDGEIKYFDKSFLTFYEPSFASMRGNMGIAYNPQNLNIVDGNTSGWLKAQTWEGDQWMYPGVAETVAVNNNFYVYNEPSFTADKGAGGNQFGPQKFLPILEKRQDGWWKVVTYEGPKWVALNGTRMKVDVNFTTFDQPYLESYKRSSFLPQTVTVHDGKKTEQGDFYLITTYQGQKWMSINAEKEFNENRESMRQALGYNENTFDDDSVTVNTRQSDNMPIKAEPTKLKIPTKEEREAFLMEVKDDKKRGLTSRAMPEEWVRRGDVVYTPNSWGGLVGHTAIIVTDLTNAQDYKIVHSPGIDAFPAVDLQSLEQWEFIHAQNEEYYQFRYFRNPNKSVGIAAANYAFDHFYMNRYNYTYDFWSSSAKQNNNKIYCTKLVYLSYRDGAGVDIFPMNFGIIHPADFYFQNKLVLYFKGEGGHWG